MSDSTAEERYLVLPERPQRLDEIHDGHINALIAELRAKRGVNKGSTLGPRRIT